MAEVYGRVVTSLGYENVFTGENGEDIVSAVTREKKLRPDIIIMDYRMPKMNGLEAAKKILEADKSVMIVLATADDSVIETARAIGVTPLLKPFTIGKLVRLLQGL